MTNEKNRRFFDARAKARAYLRSKNEQQQKRNTGILRFAQNDGAEQTTATATTTAKADPYGMTNKKDNGKSSDNRRSCASRDETARGSAQDDTL